ncbi:MAG: ethanolamine ammonia-lyase reactivating factor EutA [Desulfobacterales bacterium]|nr:ethanolamine ammonia-lyase reactivating factor EutA [Desulfobacterales bacterium]
MHDENHSWDHQHGVDMVPDEDHPLWASDRIELTSAGIDIGSTTSHLMFSEIELRRQGRSLSSRFQIVRKSVVYESGILLTPFIDGTTIDTDKLSEFIDRSYKESKIDPAQIQTGAVVLTGEAAKKDNAEAIAKLFSAQAGKFVCATAGHKMEGRMAAYGSGAVEKSLGEYGAGITVMNVDIGGGTTKIAVIEKGTLIDATTINVGARLVALDESNKITRVEDAAKVVAQSLGLRIGLGLELKSEQQAQMATALADSLMELVERKELSALTRKLLLNPPLSFSGKIQSIIFSGGVSEYIYGSETKGFGDLGALLAKEVMRHLNKPGFDIPIEAPEQKIRATVIGASQYTVQVSGSTIFISNDDILPLRNLQVVSLRLKREDLSGGRIEEHIHQTLQKHDLTPGESPIVLAIHWPFEPSHELLSTLVKGILSALKDAVEKNMPLVLVFDADIGRLVGNMLRYELGVTGSLVSVDGVELQDFDYIDIGEQMPDQHVVPLVIKSLVFR